jgi:hypothetical protein
LPQKAGFSNFGSRVTSNGWGTDVVTAGYGDLQAGAVTQEYTDTFSGTSSATPIVVGAAMLLNSIHLSALGTALDPLLLRNVLRDTGSAVSGTIGTRPNLRAALAALGIPRLGILSNTGPGGSITFGHDGVPASAALLYVAAAPQTPPLPFEPFGELLLELQSAFLLTSASLDAGGHGESVLPLPPSGPLSGTTFWLQAIQLFPGAGNGSFTNLVSVRLL